MKKHRLDLDALGVESFTTNGPAARAGTVVAFDAGTVNTRDVNNTCNFVCWNTIDCPGDTDHTACLECFTEGNTCTQLTDCRYPTQLETCTTCETTAC
ncbi:MAG TPA: hypothetical protein VF092_21705 [Longimicrobium sp.]